MKKERIGAREGILFVVIFGIIIYRVFHKEDFANAINFFNYVGMLLTFGAVWCKALSGTKPERNRDFSRGVLGIIIILAIVAAYFVVWLKVKIPSVINDIITLLAVWFCVCEKCFVFFIRKIFKLQLKENDNLKLKQ